MVDDGLRGGSSLLFTSQHVWQWHSFKYLNVGLAILGSDCLKTRTPFPSLLVWKLLPPSFTHSQIGISHRETLAWMVAKIHPLFLHDLHVQGPESGATVSVCFQDVMWLAADCSKDFIPMCGCYGPQRSRKQRLELQCSMQLNCSWILLELASTNITNTHLAYWFIGF